MTLKEATDMIYTQDQLTDVLKGTIPHHIAIIPDGNRRWAKSKLLDTLEGYYYGAAALVDVVKAAKELGIKVLTVYSLSTENIRRPLTEVKMVMATIETYLRRYQQMAVDMNIRIRTIGNISAFPQSVIDVIERAQEATKHCTGLELVFALNYGGRDEIVRAAQKFATLCQEGKSKPEELSPELFSKLLDTCDFPDPELLIRTSGETRISNFLVWQSSYTELYIEECNWPNFGPQGLLKAVKAYQNRTRRIGL